MSTECLHCTKNGPVGTIPVEMTGTAGSLPVKRRPTRRCCTIRRRSVDGPVKWCGMSLIDIAAAARIVDNVTDPVENAANTAREAETVKVVNE